MQGKADIRGDAIGKLCLAGTEVPGVILRARAAVTSGINEPRPDDITDENGQNLRFGFKAGASGLECRGIRHTKATKKRVDVPPGEW
jgi:hypothetical protein